jgi:hypothetical protein
VRKWGGFCVLTPMPARRCIRPFYTVVKSRFLYVPIEGSQFFTGFFSRGNYKENGLVCQCNIDVFIKAPYAALHYRRRRQRGYPIAKKLSEEDQDVTLIDRDPKKIARINATDPVQRLWGSGTNPQMLYDAGIETADMLTAATDSDETNLIACRRATLTSIWSRWSG